MVDVALTIEGSAPADLDAVVALYTSVGWLVYAKDPEGLERAMDAAHYVVQARRGDRLIGLARCLSDDVSIAYIQDILVHPDEQGKGVGRALMEDILQRYSHVRQKVLLTDDRPGQLHFYASLGFHNTRELVKTPLNAFVRYEGIEVG